MCFRIVVVPRCTGIRARWRAPHRGLLCVATSTHSRYALRKTHFLDVLRRVNRCDSSRIGQWGFHTHTLAWRLHAAPSIHRCCGVWRRVSARIQTTAQATLRRRSPPPRSVISRGITPHPTSTNEAEYAKSCTPFCLPPNIPMVTQQTQQSKVLHNVSRDPRCTVMK